MSSPCACVFLFILIVSAFPGVQVFAKTGQEAAMAQYLDSLEFSQEREVEKEMIRKIGVGYRYAFLNVDDADYKAQGHTNRNYGGLVLVYELGSRWAVELELGSYKLVSKVYSEVKATNLLVNFQRRFGKRHCIPYAVGGLGFQHYRYDLGEGDKKDKSFSQAYKVGGGMEYAFDDHWRLGTEIAYVYGNTGGEATLDVYQWRYSGGINYYY